MPSFKSLILFFSFSLLFFDSYSQSHYQRNKRCHDEPSHTDISKLVFSSSYRFTAYKSDSTKDQASHQSPARGTFTVTPLMIDCDLEYPGTMRYFSYASLISPTQFTSDEFSYKHRIFCRKSGLTEELRITARSFPHNNRLHRIKLLFWEDRSMIIQIKYAGRRYTYHGHVAPLTEDDYQSLNF